MFNIIDLQHENPTVVQLRALVTAVNMSKLAGKIDRSLPKKQLIENLDGSPFYVHYLPEMNRNACKSLHRQANCHERVEYHFYSRADDLYKYIDNYDIYENGSEYLPPFHEYGLCFDLVEMGTFPNQDKPYYRYQLSYGGPTEEFRIYRNWKVEFWLLDWFDGDKIDVTDDPVTQFIISQFEPLMNWDNVYDSYEEEEGIETFYCELCDEDIDGNWKESAHYIKTIEGETIECCDDCHTDAVYYMDLVESLHDADDEQCEYCVEQESVRRVYTMRGKPYSCCKDDDCKAFINAWNHLD